MKEDIFFLLKALKLAKKGKFTTSPNPNVGCIIVRNGKIIGHGFHKKKGQPHAEINALKMAGKLAQGSTIYTTLEPCNYYGTTPPCTHAIIKNKISKVVIGMIDPNPKVSGKGIEQLKQAGIKVSKNKQLLKKIKKINQGFIKRMETGSPWVKLKLAISLDGKIATQSGESKWITSIQSRKNAQILRAESDAILSTSSTIIKDNPFLNVRHSSLPLKIQKIYKKYQILKQPIRIIIDNNNKIKDLTKYKITKTSGKIWLIKSNANISISRLKTVQEIAIPTYTNKIGEKKINLNNLMKELGKRKINTILVESGAKLAGSLLQKQLVDELIIYQSPKILGHNAISFCISNQLKTLKDALKFNLINMKKIGPDIRIMLQPNN